MAAGAPRVCGDDPSDKDDFEHDLVALPAYAGMILTARLADDGGGRAPRVCGDDPSDVKKLITDICALPAYAGMIPHG